MLTLQVAVPTNGSTVLSDGSNVLMLNHSSLIAGATVTFPSTPRDGQMFMIGSKSAITVVSVSSAKTVLGGITTMAALGWGTWVYSQSADVWVRVG